VEVALDLTNGSKSSLECTSEFVELAWPESAGKKMKETFAKALQGAFEKGLKLRILAERLKGYSAPVTFDPEFVCLLSDISRNGGSCNKHYALLCFLT